MNSLLKYIAVKSFNDGLDRCNILGKKLITKKGAERFLDVGCGEGSLTMEFAEVIEPKKIYGIEFVDEVRLQAESKGIECIKCDLNSNWDYDDDYFDIILSSQNIEHMHHTRLYLEECYRCLKPGGQLVILTENLASWVNIGSLLFGWQPFSTTNISGWSVGNPFIWHVDEQKDDEHVEKWRNSGVTGVVGHVRVLSSVGLRDFMEKVGFKDITISTKGFLPLWGSLSDLLCSIDKRHGHFLIASGYK